jgi:hypothetical protein
MSVAAAAKAVETATSQKEAVKAKLKTKDEELRELRAYKKDTEELRAQCEADKSMLARFVRFRPSASVPFSPHLCAVLPPGGHAGPRRQGRPAPRDHAGLREQDA